MTTVRFAVIGTNFISDWFCEAAALCHDVSVDAVLSRAADTGAAFASQHVIPKVYTDEGTMLADAAIDAVYVASPSYRHAPMTEAALRAGKHVLCEKPLTLSAPDAEHLFTLARERGRVLLEAMRPDFDPAYDVLTAALPRLGMLRRAHLCFCQYSSRYDAFRRGEVLRAFDPSIGNSALADIGIYPLRLAVTLFGAPHTLSAQSVYLSNGFEGAGEVLLGYGTHTVTVSYSKVADAVCPSVLEGEAGSITVDRLTEPRCITWHPRRGEPTVVYERTQGGNMPCEIEAFAAMVRGERDATPYVERTRLTMRLFDEIKRQTAHKA